MPSATVICDPFRKTHPENDFRHIPTRSQASRDDR